MIYLDYAASTPNERMIKSYFGNSASSHVAGIEAAQAEEKARIRVAMVINAKPEEIIFTSGGTEANNLAIFGLAFHKGFQNMRILCSPTVHHSILEPCLRIKDMGGSITFCDIDSNGKINIEDVHEKITHNTYDLFAFDYVNNEIGTVQDAVRLCAIARERFVYTLVDAVQTLPHLPINVKEIGCDMLSISAHKIYGPRGVGVLYKKKNMKLYPLISGGEQESGYRGGTKNSGLIEAFGWVMLDNGNCLLRQQKKDKESCDCLKMKLGPDQKYYSPKDAIPSIVNLVTEVDNASLVNLLSERDIAVSTGAACGGAFANSHVIKAIGGDPQRSLRVSFGRYTTPYDIDQFVTAYQECTKELKGE